MTRAVLLVALLAACRDSECEPSDPDACDDGMTCEQVISDDEDAPPYACFPPVKVRGDVFDVSDASPIEGARVVPLDANGAPAGRVGVSDEDGHFAVVVSVDRDEEGTPLEAGSISLRADAAGYQSFPGGVRSAQPIALSEAVQEEAGDDWVIDTPQTDIGLIALEPGYPEGAIYGIVHMAEGQSSALVVAEQGSTGLNALADLDGDYAIFNVPAGSWSATGYAQDVQHEVVTVDVADSAVKRDLDAADAATAAVTGSVNIVNAPGGAETSVILVVASTFDALTGRGAAPPGLRVAGVSGSYTLTGVPDGRYVVLGAFEDDGLVRDPDYEQGGTELQTVTVSGADASVDGFKITEALEIFAPGGDGPEVVGSTPLLTWADDSSEKRYDILVFDSLGRIVWETSIDGTSGSDPAVTYAGEPLESGMYYQFRVTSIDQGGVPIRRTQDLDGGFQVQ